MGASVSTRKRKRIRDGEEDDYNPTLSSLREIILASPRDILEALKMDENQIVCPILKLIKCIITHEELHLGNLEPLLSKIVCPNVIFGQLMKEYIFIDQTHLGQLLENCCQKSFSECNEVLPIILRPNSPGNFAGGSAVVPPPASASHRIQGSGGQKLQLRFETKMPSFLFSGDDVKGEGGSVIRVVLIDLSNGSIVQTGPASAANLNIVVLQGDIKDGWKHGFPKSDLVKERDRKPPILVGNVQVMLKGGVGILGGFSFTDNSSCTRSGMFRLGVELASGFDEGICVMEGITNAFRVKDKRGKAYGKHDPPALHDEVWRLKGIAKDGPLHKKLNEAKIIIVEDLLRLHTKDPQRLRTILGKGMADKMWKTTINHAKKFSPLGEKVYVFYTDGTQSSGVIFNHIHEPAGFITNGQIVQLESLGQPQKLSYLVKKAYENWDQVVEYDEQNLIQQIQPQYTSVPQQSLEPPVSSSDPEKGYPQNDWTGMEDPDGEGCLNEMREIDGIGHGMLFGASFNESNKVYDLPDMEEDPHFDDWDLEAEEPEYRSAKAVVGWLKIKAALKWGIMVRNCAAKKRATLAELD